MPRCHKSAKASAELVGANCRVGWQTGYEVGGKRDKPSTPGDGVDKSCKKDQWTDNEIFHKCRVFSVAKIAFIWL